MQNLFTLALLLASAASLHVQNGEKCACLTWKSVYENGGLLCGQGYEIGLVGPKGIKLSREAILSWAKDSPYYKVDCTDGYMKTSFSMCLNKGFASPEAQWSPEQWCYVGRECQEAEPVEGTDFAIKTCTDQDARMSTVTPEELNKIGAADGLSLQRLAMHAWALDKDVWYSVEASAGISEDEEDKTHDNAKYDQLSWTVEPYSKTKAAKLQKIRDSGNVTIFSTEEYGPGGFPTLLAGKKTYAYLWIIELNQRGYVCIDGCDA